MNVLRLEDSNRSLKPLLVAYIVNLHFFQKLLLTEESIILDIVGCTLSTTKTLFYTLL
jgi:hypothetical protein